MADESQDSRLRQVMEAYVGRRLELSLGRVSEAISAWREGRLDLASAHVETLKHAARASALSARVARSAIDGPASLLRDAVELGLLSAQELESLTGKTVAEIPLPPPLDEDASRGPAMPDKQTVLDKLLQDGPVLVHLDARRPGVEVPASHAQESGLVLRLGYNLSPPIPDLSFDEKAVRATLSFRGEPFLCVIPWTAVYAIVAEDSRGMVWPEDVPPEAGKDFTEEVKKRAREPEERPKKGGHLRLVE